MLFIVFNLPCLLSGEAGSGLVDPTGVKHPAVPLEQEEFRALEHQEELGVNKSPVGPALGSARLLGLLVQLCCSWNVGRSCSRGNWGVWGLPSKPFKHRYLSCCWS